MSEWYYMSGGQQHGPVTGAQLKALASSGGLTPEDMVWNQTMPEWVAARRVRGLPFAGQAPAAVKATPAPVHAGSAARAVAAPVHSAAPADSDNSYDTATPTEEASPFTDAAAARSEHANHGRSHAATRTAVSPTAADAFGKARSKLILMALLSFLLFAVSLAVAAYAGLDKFDSDGKILNKTLKEQCKPYNPIDPKLNVETLSIAGGCAFIFFVLMILLGRYSGKIKKFTATQRQALNWKTRCGPRIRSWSLCSSSCSWASPEALIRTFISFCTSSSDEILMSNEKNVTDRLAPVRYVLLIFHFDPPRLPALICALGRQSPSFRPTPKA